MGWSERYWKQNRERILEDRKRKYAEDPDYRAKAQKRAKDYRDQKRDEREAFLKKPYLMLEGVKVPALTADQMCSRIGIERNRLKYLQKAGYLPDPRKSNGARLYTYGQADMVKDLNEFLRENTGLLRVSDATASADLEAKLYHLHQEWENF